MATEEDIGPSATVTAKVNVPWSNITNAIVGALEGGSSYWLREIEYADTPDGLTEKPFYAETEFWTKGGRIIFKYDDPEDDECRAETTIGQAELLVGLEMMAVGTPSHFGDLVSENDDAITHDTFIQYVLFGDVIYG